MQLTGFDFIVRVADCDETSVHTEPSEMAMEIARKKANAVVCETDDIIIGADTVVVTEGKALGKPKDKEQAKTMLRMLSGKVHSVYTGVCIRHKGEDHCFCSKTDVKFYDLDESTIEWYVGTEEPMDKAGSYGIQGKGALLVEKIDGDYYNVVGLPVARVNNMLKKLM